MNRLLATRLTPATRRQADRWIDCFTGAMLYAELAQNGRWWDVYVFAPRSVVRLVMQNGW